MLGGLLTDFRGFLHLGDLAFNLFQILALQLEIDNLDVSHRIHGPFLVGEGRVVEAAEHVDERVAETHVREEAVADAGAGARTLRQSGDIDDVQVGIDQFVGMDERVDVGQTLVGHRAHTDV